MQGVPDTEFQTYSSTLHIAQAECGEAPRSIRCSVERFHGNHLRVLTPERLAIGVPVSVEHDDVLLLGEIVQVAEEASSWSLEIRVEQMLNGLMSLMALRARLLQESPAQTPSSPRPVSQ